MNSQVSSHVPMQWRTNENLSTGEKKGQFYQPKALLELVNNHLTFELLAKLIWKLQGKGRTHIVSVQKRKASTVSYHSFGRMVHRSKTH